MRAHRPMHGDQTHPNFAHLNQAFDCKVCTCASMRRYKWSWMRRTALLARRREASTRRSSLGPSHCGMAIRKNMASAVSSCDESIASIAFLSAPAFRRMHSCSLRPAEAQEKLPKEKLIPGTETGLRASHSRAPKIHGERLLTLTAWPWFALFA